jgi:hypothetical protein
MVIFELEIFEPGISEPEKQDLQTCSIVKIE